MSDMHGNAVRVAESEAGAERMNADCGTVYCNANTRKLIRNLAFRFL
jgi:hypothetical protein